MQRSSNEVPVLVVGAGPVGLTAAILLARLGIASRVVERREAPQRAPAAHVVNARTFEILRAAGLDMAEIDRACKSPADAGHVRWVTTLAGEELGRLPFERQGDDVLALTPTPLRNLSQHRLEPILLEHLRKRTGVEVAYGHAWESAAQDADGVTSRIRDGAGTREVRSRWLLAADGAGSRVRRSVGIEPVGPARLQSFVMIHFEADLRPLVHERPGVLYWIADPDAGGVFVAHDIDSTWVYMHAWDPEQESADAYGEAVCERLVRRALGTDACALAIRNVSTWTMTAQVAERYRAGRIFLVGDSAHRFPPTGGLGLNTGVQDAHNLAWKLAAVEAGWAPDALLGTYETERRPVAQTNADVSARNALKLLEVASALGLGPDREASRAAYAATLADPAGRARVAEAIARQAEHFDMLGLQLGFAYEAGALVPDGSDPPAVADPVREYVPSARPGARVPHAWVERDGARISTLDRLPGDRFALVTGPDASPWRDAAAAIDDVPVAWLPAEAGWRERLGIGPGGAVLVRPDQHVAWRAREAVADPRAALCRALARILSP